jgi:tetratricopeptide (TPR) repeat protein
MSTAKKDEKRVKELKLNRDAALVGLYNKGIAAMGRAGTVASTTERTTDEGTAQAKMEKEKGTPGDFARWTEGGTAHEVWYYPKDQMAYYFSPTGEEPAAIPVKPFELGGDLRAAVVDSTAFGEYQGASKILDAAYNFELAALVDPTSPDVYKNLSYLYELVGRVDDAIAAAKVGLTIKPGDGDLIRNMKVAAMGRGNRLYNAGKYKDATAAYWAAIQVDPANQFITFRASRSMAPARSRFRKARADDTTTRTALRTSTVAGQLQAIRENAVFNMAVIDAPDNMKAAGRAAKGSSRSRRTSICSVCGQVRYRAADYNGSVSASGRQSS